LTRSLFCSSNYGVGIKKKEMGRKEERKEKGENIKEECVKTL
jgi:hypothetical protein